MKINKNFHFFLYPLFMTCAFINILKIYYSIKNRSTGTRVTDSASPSYTNVNPLLTPSGAYLVQTHLRGWGGGRLTETGGLLERGAYLI